jgi:hypothetical protein
MRRIEPRDLIGEQRILRELITQTGQQLARVLFLVVGVFLDCEMVWRYGW